MGSGGCVVERQAVNQGDSGSISPSAVSFFVISFTPHLPVSFRRDTKSRWSLLSGVYARGSKRSHTGAKCVTCSGLTNSRKGQLLRQPMFGLFGGNHLRPVNVYSTLSQCHPGFEIITTYLTQACVDLMANYTSHKVSQNFAGCLQVSPNVMVYSSKSQQLSQSVTECHQLFVLQLSC